MPSWARGLLGSWGRALVGRGCLESRVLNSIPGNQPIHSLGFSFLSIKWGHSLSLTPGGMGHLRGAGQAQADGVQGRPRSPALQVSDSGAATFRLAIRGKSRFEPQFSLL